MQEPGEGPIARRRTPGTRPTRAQRGAGHARSLLAECRRRLPDAHQRRESLFEARVDQQRAIRCGPERRWSLAAAGGRLDRELNPERQVVGHDAVCPACETGRVAVLVVETTLPVVREVFGG